MSEKLPDGTVLRWRDWLLPWRARRVIRFYACALAIEQAAVKAVEAKAKMDVYDALTDKGERYEEP